MAACNVTVVRVSAACCLVIMAAGWQENGAPISREVIVGWLRHQEDLVESAVVDYTVTFSPTRPEMVPLIHEACEYLGSPGEEDRFILTRDEAQRKNYRERWFREGSKERRERYSPVSNGDQRPKEVSAFDGSFIRSFSRTGSGSFETTQSSPWLKSDMVTPYSMLYEFIRTRYSEIVELGTEFTATAVDRNGRTWTEVNVKHPTAKGFEFVLVFDEEQRLVERDVLAPGRSPDPDESVPYVRTELMDYRPHRDASGETIWFPHRAVYHYYMARLPSGQRVEYWTETVDVQQIRLNVDIPDELFVPEFPRDAKVWDGVYGLGWIGGEELKAASEAKVAGQTSRVKWLVLFNLCLLALVLSVWGIRRLRQRRGAGG